MARISKAKQIAELVTRLALDYRIACDDLMDVVKSEEFDGPKYDRWIRSDERVIRTQQRLKDLGIPVNLIA